MCWSQSEMKYSNSIRGEIYEAYPWLGPAQVPAEPDEFVCMTGVVQIDGLIRHPAATVPAAKQRCGSKDKDSIMSLKSAHRSGDVQPYLARLLPFQRCGALTSCSIAAISPCHQCFLATPKGNAGFGLQVRKISPCSPNASAQIS